MSYAFKGYFTIGCIPLSAERAWICCTLMFYIGLLWMLLVKRLLIKLEPLSDILGKTFDLKAAACWIFYWYNWLASLNPLTSAVVSDINFLFPSKNSIFFWSALALFCCCKMPIISWVFYLFYRCFLII
jgi:hypothetical protein